MVSYEAAALAKQSRAAIIRQNSAQLRRVDTKHCIKDAWAKVRQLTGAHKNRSCYSSTKFTARDLNNHFAAISSDEHYQKTFPKIRPTAASRSCDISELEVFRMLDRLQPTTTGPDLIPSWFLRLGAPAFSAPLAQLFNQSIHHSGVVPRQWKNAFITPIPQTVHPAEPSDFRPISITSVLSRSFERHVVRMYIYPALQQPPPDLSFSDQFAFRPTGSTTAALISLPHSISTMLTECPYVRVIALDLARLSTDTVRHISLLQKMARLYIPDEDYNCIRSMATHTVRSSAQRHLHLLTLWPVSSRAHPLDQPHSLSQLLTYILFSPATSSLNSLTIPGHTCIQH